MIDGYVGTVLLYLAMFVDIPTGFLSPADAENGRRRLGLQAFPAKVARPSQWNPQWLTKACANCSHEEWDDQSLVPRPEQPMARIFNRNNQQR